MTQRPRTSTNAKPKAAPPQFAQGPFQSNVPQSGFPPNAMMQQQPQRIQQATQSPPPAQVPAPVTGGGLFGFNSKKLFGGSTKKLMLGGGGALLAGILGKKVLDETKGGHATQQTQYQRPQQDPNAGYGHDQPTQNQTTNGYADGYTDPSTPVNYVEAQQEANNDLDALQLSEYENANQIWLDNQALEASQQMAETEVESAEFMEELA
jgi:hypothetical protein